MSAPEQQGGEQDLLDKGVSMAAEKSGHKLDRSKVEKISDGIRKVFKKLTGKDVPVEDKN